MAVPMKIAVYPGRLARHVAYVLCKAELPPKAFLNAPIKFLFFSTDAVVGVHAPHTVRGELLTSWRNGWQSYGWVLNAGNNMVRCREGDLVGI